MASEPTSVTVRASWMKKIEKMESKPFEELAYTDILDEPFKDVCTVFGKPYKTLTQLKDRHISLNSNMRVPRFRFVLCKGPKQFGKLVAKYNTVDTYKDMKKDEIGVFGINDDFSLIIDFYSEMFGGGEYSEIVKLRTDIDYWHLIFVGFADLKRKEEATVKRLFNILGVVSFKVVDSGASFLKWLAVSSIKPVAKTWGKRKQDQEGFSIFDNKTFKFKGIGSSLMFYMQEMGLMISSLRKQKQSLIPRIVLESSNEAVPFYKYGLGFMECRSVNSNDFIDAINASDLTKLSLSDRISSIRPLTIPEDLSPVDLLDNVVYWLYGAKSQERDLNYTGEFLFTAKRTPLKFFLEVTIVKNPQKSLACNIAANSTPLQRSQTLLSKLLGLNDSNASLHIIPTKSIGLFILRCIVFNHIQSKASTITDFFEGSSANSLKHFFSVDALQGFEKERQLIATMCWFLTKMKAGIAAAEYQDGNLYKRKFDPTKQDSNVSWFDQNLLKRPPTAIESMFMTGNLIDHLVAGLKDTITKRPEVATDRCAPLMLHFWLQRFGQDLVKKDESTDSDYFLSFVSCLFNISITRISFKKKKPPKSKKMPDSWDISYSHCNKNPESDEHVAQLILCNVFPSKSVFDPKDVEWSILFDNSCNVPLLMQNLATFAKDEAKNEAIKKAHEETVEYNAKIVEAAVYAHYQPISDLYGLHCLCVKACLMDNEDWPFFFIENYIALLHRSQLIDNDTYAEALSLERLEYAFGDEFDLSSYKRFAVIYWEDNHFIVCVITLEEKTIDWYDSQPVSQNHNMPTIEAFLTRYSLLGHGDSAKWTIRNETSSHNFVRDCGPIALEDFEYALNVQGFVRYTEPLKRKIGLIQKLVKMYTEFLKDNKSDDVVAIPKKQREKVYVNMGYMANHLEANISLYKDYPSVCRLCDVRFSMQETLITRNCSKFCTYHEKCFMDNFSKNEECNICQIKGCSYMKYALDLTKNDNQLGIEELVQWKQFIEGFEYGGLQIGRMFNQDELQEASLFVNPSDLELAKIALDPRQTDKEYVSAVYEEVEQFRIMNLRPQGWLSCDVIKRIADLLVQQHPRIEVIITYYKGRNGKVNFNFDEMEDGNIYLFVVNEKQFHWAIIECHGKSHVYNCFGFLESDIKFLENLFKSFFDEEQTLPSEASFAFGPGYKEFQDGCSCGIVVLRRIQVRANNIEAFDKEALEEADFASLGNYNSSRISYAAMIARHPSTRDAFLADEIAAVGQGNANSPLKYTSPEHVPAVDHAVSGMGTSTSPLNVMSQAEQSPEDQNQNVDPTKAMPPAESERTEAKKISYVLSDDEKEQPATEAQEIASTAKLQEEDQPELEFSGDDESTITQDDLSDKENASASIKQSNQVDNPEIIQEDLGLSETGTAVKRKRGIMDEAIVQDENMDKEEAFNDDLDVDDTSTKTESSVESQIVGANNQGKILRVRQKPGPKAVQRTEAIPNDAPQIRPKAVQRTKAIPKDAQLARKQPMPEQTSSKKPGLRLKIKLPTKTPKKRDSRQQDIQLPLKKRQKRQQAETKKVPAKDLDMEDFVGKVVYPFDKNATELDTYTINESFFQRIEMINENTQKYNALVARTKLANRPLNETTDCMIEKLCNANNFKTKFESRIKGLQRQNVFREEDWDFEELKRQCEKRYAVDKNSSRYDGGPVPHTNEIFFRHPNSLIAIRYKKPSFEAITAPVFGENEDTSLTVRVPEQWVKEHFDKEFVEQLMKHSNSCEIVHFKESEKNVTEETKALASAKRDIPLFYKQEMRGASDVMLIMKLKLKATYHSNSVTSTTEVWMIISVDKDRYIKERDLDRRRAEKHRHKNLEQFYSDWLEIESDILEHEECVGTKTPKELRAEVQASRQKFLNTSQTHANQEYTYESNIHNFDDIHKDNGIVNVDKVPHYKAALKQIAALRYDEKRKHFYGQVLESVTSSGQRKYTKEIFLNDEWVEEQFSQEFIAKLKERSNSKKYVWVPCGKATKRKFPYKYNTAYPKIRYQQGTRDTCASSSLASCLHAMGFVDIAAWIELFGVAYLKQESESVNFLSCLMFNLQKSRKDFNKEYGFKKLAPNKFDIFRIDNERKQYPKLLQLLGSDGGVAHAITVHNGLIYDSNLFRAVDLNQLNLEFCMDAVYTSIINGYELIPQKVLRKEALKNAKQNRNK